ncbi:efflux RND transporter periplasmic adaptor subunit [Thermomonas sp.]|uniref:efflux RND transporter periplasmic adaptor subunit n=1 Tax=Thermomonas sp. TaxID=1971895 RepID=UPI0035AFD246
MNQNWKAAARDNGRRARRALAVTCGVIAATVVAAALSASFATSASTTPNDAVAPVAAPATALTVEVTRPQRRTVARALQAAGSVAAREELVIGSDANGVRLLEVRVDVGSTVRRGELLARGDDAPLQAQRRQLDAQIRQARVELAQAESNFERADRIRDSGVYSPEALQTRRTAADAAAARLELAQAQAAELDLRIAQARVLAPAGGVIARRSATVGSVMQPGLELFRLIRDDEIEWRAELPDQAIEQVKPGALAVVRIDATRTVQGKVRLVAPTVDPRTRNGIAYVSLPPGTPLRSGGHAQGEVRVGSAEVWTLPESALLSRDGQAYVYVIGADGAARATRVQTGVRQAGAVEVIGLPAETAVVTTGAGFVKDGERVRVAIKAQGGRT